MTIKAIREDVIRDIQRLRQADLLVGIPCFNNEETIAYVIRQISRGLK